MRGRRGKGELSHSGLWPRGRPRRWQGTGGGQGCRAAPRGERGRGGQRAGASSGEPATHLGTSPRRRARGRVLFTPYTHRGPANPRRASPLVRTPDDQSARTVLLRRQSERGGSGAAAVSLRADGVGRAGLCGRRCLARGARLDPSCHRRLQTRAGASRRPRLRWWKLARSHPTWLCLRSASSRRRVPDVGRGLYAPPAPLHRAAGKVRERARACTPGPLDRARFLPVGPPCLVAGLLVAGLAACPQGFWAAGLSNPPLLPPVPDEARKPAGSPSSRIRKGKGCLDVHSGLLTFPPGFVVHKPLVSAGRFTEFQSSTYRETPQAPLSNFYF